MRRRFRLWALLVALAVPAAAAAQGPRATANSNGQAQGQAQGPIQSALSDPNQQDQPIQIESATLEVHDKSKMATFAGDVQVVQGDTTIKCQTLVVFYGADHPPAGGQAVASAAPVPPNSGAQGGQAAPSGQAAPGGRSQPGVMPQSAHDIRRIEARGGVTVVSKDQNSSGDFGVYDLKKKTITLTGNVVVSQGKNVLHGDRVVVDTTTGNAHFESGATSQNRVRALILPNKTPNANGGPSNTMSIGPPRPN
jgi:lipopolysaccharide export system protein LptA